ncbi:CLUMA_CG004004, isoform A [Clunio marinus]|uniref:CLUMA_CG004004, isoform A n=1 Tax=Clunio marinus TaxID=568069 RepID=A0A1J1HVV8_9DIPT|nr:CLUMA_CG004004, isoform A [Clunio marinus]
MKHNETDKKKRIVRKKLCKRRSIKF